MNLRAFRRPVPSTAVWIAVLATAAMAISGSYGDAEVRPDQVSRSVEQGGALLEAAETAYGKGRYQDALSFYSRAVALMPEESSVYLGRGMTFEMMGKAVKAAKDYQKAIQCDPENYRAMENLAGLLERSGKGISEAVRLYERALQLDPRPTWRENLRVWIEMLQTRVDPRTPSAVGLLNRATGHAKRGDLDNAVRTYSAALAVNPNLYQAYFGRGLARLKSGRLDQALADFDATVAIAPRWAPGLINRGLVHEKMGRQQDALEAFHRAAEVDPRDATAHYHLGRLLEEKGESRAALESYQEAVRLKPKAPLRELLQRRISAVGTALKSRPKEKPGGVNMRKHLW